MKNLFWQVYVGTLMWCFSMRGCFVQALIWTYRIFKHIMLWLKPTVSSNLCYRAGKYTSFVIINHKSCSHMNGCHGKIVCYDNVLITSNNANQSEGYITALPPGVMEPTYCSPRREKLIKLPVKQAWHPNINN